MIRGTLAALLAAVCFAALAAAQPKPAPKPKPAAPREPSAAAEKARENYRLTCVPCHGPDGRGVIPESNLADGKWKRGSTTAAIAKSISDGVKGTAMLPFKDRFSAPEILELAKLVRSMSVPAKATKPAGK